MINIFVPPAYNRSVDTLPVALILLMCCVCHLTPIVQQEFQRRPLINIYPQKKRKTPRETKLSSVPTFRLNIDLLHSLWSADPLYLLLVHLIITSKAPAYASDTSTSIKLVTNIVLILFSYILVCRMAEIYGRGRRNYRCRLGSQLLFFMGDFSLLC